MSTCKCGRDTRDNAHVCDPCLDTLTQALAETPHLDHELETTLTGTKGIDYRRSGGTPSTEHRLPIHAGASEARAHLRDTLTAWTRYCHDEHVRNQSPKPGLPPPTTAAMSRWLMWRVDGLGLLDIGGEAVAEITEAVARGKRIIDRPAAKWFIGPCEACGTALYAQPNTDTVKCRATLNRDADDERCGHVVDVRDKRATLLEQAEDRLATAAEVSRAVSWLGAAPLTAALVRKWAERGRIVAHGHNGKSPLYRIGDAIDILASSTKDAV